MKKVIKFSYSVVNKKRICNFVFAFTKAYTFSNFAVAKVLKDRKTVW